ncbi:unnamed protein product, partial [Citrullus colocynthis]
MATEIWKSKCRTTANGGTTWNGLSDPMTLLRAACHGVWTVVCLLTIVSSGTLASTTCCLPLEARCAIVVGDSEAEWSWLALGIGG